jgi:hypothetical protein
MIVNMKKKQKKEKVGTLVRVIIDGWVLDID